MYYTGTLPSVVSLTVEVPHLSVHWHREGTQAASTSQRMLMLAWLLACNIPVSDNTHMATGATLNGAN